MNPLITIQSIIFCIQLSQASIGTVLLDNPFSFHRRVAKRTKEDYELCLQRKKEKPERTVLLVPQGSQLRLSCATLCLKPKESVGKIWRFSPQKLLHIQALDVNNDRLYIASDLALEIKDATLDDNGTYYCIYNRQLMATHTVDVVPEEPNRIVLETNRLRGKTVAKVLKTWLLKENNLKLYTKWSEWSTCSRCDRTGLRKKYGICTLKKIHMSEATKPVDIPLALHDLNAYKMTEIPCRSSMLPDKIANLKLVKERASETLYGFCNVSCPNTRIEFVTDSSGKIIETVDKSKNLYSFKQKLPDLPGFVKRAYVYEEEGTKIVLKCPGETIGKFIQWRNGSYALNPTKVHRMTKGRIKIDYLNQLHIRHLLISDSSIYSCWHNNKMMATIKLIVEAKPKATLIRELFHHLGTYFVLLLIVLLSISILKNRNIQSKK